MRASSGPTCLTKAMRTTKRIKTQQPDKTARAMAEAAADSNETILASSHACRVPNDTETENGGRTPPLYQCRTTVVEGSWVKIAHDG
jgi:hypothetical protein